MPLSTIRSQVNMQLGAHICYYLYIGVALSETRMTTVPSFRWDNWRMFSQVKFWTLILILQDHQRLRMCNGCLFNQSVRLIEKSTVIFGALPRLIHHCRYFRRKYYIHSAQFIRTIHFIVIVFRLHWINGILRGMLVSMSWKREFSLPMNCPELT